MKQNLLTWYSGADCLFTEHLWVCYVNSNNSMLYSSQVETKWRQLCLFTRHSRVQSLFTERPWVYAMAPAVLVRRAFRVDSLFTAHPGAKEVTALTPTTCSCLQSVLGFCGTLQVPGRRAPEQSGSVQTEAAARGAKQLVFQQFPQLRGGPATRQTARPLCQPGQVHPKIWHTRVSCGT